MITAAGVAAWFFHYRLQHRKDLREANEAGIRAWREAAEGHKSQADRLKEEKASVEQESHKTQRLLAATKAALSKSRKDAAVFRRGFSAVKEEAELFKEGFTIAQEVVNRLGVVTFSTYEVFNRAGRLHDAHEIALRKVFDEATNTVCEGFSVKLERVRN